MSARIPLDPATGDRLAKLCGLFGSHHDGERANAARMADALVREHGLTWGDVIRMPAPPIGDWRAAARFRGAHQDPLSPREINFIVTLSRWRGELTAKQQKWLGDIVARLQEDAA